MSSFAVHSTGAGQSAAGGTHAAAREKWDILWDSALGAAARKRLVAELALRRLTVPEISAALGALPEGQRPASWSSSAVGRDLKELRTEWAAAQAADVGQLVGEEVARLNELEKVWWPKALAGDGGATDRVLAIQRQRARSEDGDENEPDGARATVRAT